MAGSALLSPSVERVRAALAQAGHDAHIVELSGAARTAQEAARHLGCALGQIANSLVFRCARSGEPLLVMASGANRVDTARLEALVGEPIGKADAAFVRERTGFAIGGVAPLGHPQRLRTLIDRDLAAQGTIWAAAGHPHTVFRLDFAALVRLTGGAPAELAVRPAS
jgi:prolyl-tRNA editing enzyme YbaK/EbsC (Cys-tRNA(Pro) deacylase)